MLSFFRRALSSWLVMALLALIMIAFIVTGVETQGTGGLGLGGSSTAIARVGGRDIEPAEVTARAQSEVARAREQQPGLTMAAFVNGGGLMPIIAQLMDTRAIEAWARDAGIVASQRLVDGEIASVPAFAGPTGQFDPNAMRQILAQQRITEAQLRADAAGDLIRRQVLVPLASGATASAGLARPYAALLLEQREGLIGVVPAASIPPGPAPTEAEVAAEYRRNVARYTVPERRTIRYAAFSPATLGAAAQPSEAEIAAAYKADTAKYAPSEQRTLQRVILQDEAAAKALAARVRGGTAFAAAAEAAGFGASDIAVPAGTRAAFAAFATPAVADAAWAQKAGGVTDPVRTPLGWQVVHIVSIRQEPGKTLAEARPEIIAALTARKAEDQIAARVDRLEKAIEDGATFEEAARAEKLTIETTPPLLAGGLAPDRPDYQLAPDLAPVLKTVFEAQAGDDPTVESLGAGKGFALVALGQIVPQAPRPLAEVRAQVAADLVARRAEDRARTITNAIVAKAQKGMPLAQAIAEAKLGLPAPQPVTARRIDLSRAERPVPPLQLLFGLENGKTQSLPIPQGQGFYVVQVRKIVPGDASKDEALAAQVRSSMGGVVAEELLQQFATAAKQQVKAERRDPAIARLRAELAGQPLPGQ
ncbi:MAG: SurA N-terminal domain-containing protein [Sphingomonas fennica]